jgi:mono/diheme cytochrome c family protein
MRGFVVGVVVTLLLLACGGFLVANRGWFPIGADNAPGTIEKRVANMATDAYVEGHAPKQGNPVQPTPSALSDGARNFEMHCSLCHGGAAQRISSMRAKLSPPVPQIINHIPGDPDANLWWIVKHGIRMTGMPSWDGILSDQEIWQVVAFVKHSDKLPPEAMKAWKEAAGVQ